MSEQPFDLVVATTPDTKDLKCTRCGGLDFAPSGSAVLLMDTRAAEPMPSHIWCGGCVKIKSETFAHVARAMASAESMQAFQAKATKQAGRRRIGER